MALLASWNPRTRLGLLCRRGAERPHGRAQVERFTLCLSLSQMARYLQRVSYLLRQGGPVVDVALLLPTDDAWSRFKAGSDSVSDSMQGLLGPSVIPQILAAGLNFDFVDAEAIEKIGIPYPVLVLAGVERLPLSTCQKIKQYVEKGGLAIAVRTLPSIAPGFLEGKPDTPKVQAIMEKLFRDPGAQGYFLADDNRLTAFLDQHFTADIATSPRSEGLGFVHRKLAFADVYFLANTTNRALSTTAAFRNKGCCAEWWDPYRGEISPAQTNASLELRLQPYESRVLVWGVQGALSKSNSNALAGERGTGVQTIDLGSDWTVSFPSLSRTIRMDALRSWTDDEETRFYSGEAVYEKDFTVPDHWLGDRTWIDFGLGSPVEPPANGLPHFEALLEGPVREAALIFLNGRRESGSIWKPPYQLDVTSSIHPGQNRIRIAVYNLAVNALAGRALPDYRLLNSRYGERFKPQDLEKLEPLPSGLVTTPRLVTETPK